YETADLLYHLIVLLTEEGVSLGEIREELEKRRK
ncbi:MAG TPA: bifunctional phosphoribosyl-AMP cyclohydrolase/phosphoribosyl-ATP pyrophosphatase, partial [Clostridia bacterium]|nr:bifunctional phosphoribosyl-AMP cyclohydrolase/phosphoribosyl-ATP pyrophosphatase [Clostridia bacterium]